MSVVGNINRSNSENLDEPSSILTEKDEGKPIEVEESFIEDTGGVDKHDTDLEEMKPLFYFLASALNVELVYIILKSIT